MATFVCILLLISNAFPVAAASSNPTKGEDSLKEIQNDSEEVLRSGPASMEEVQSKAKNGINGIQGDADKNQMHRPENSEDSTTVEEKVKEFFNGLTGSEEK
jgi:hypothetical protein